MGTETLDELLQETDRLMEDLEAAGDEQASDDAERAALLITGRLVEKVDAIGQLLDDWEAKATACVARGMALRERGWRFERRAKRLKQFVVAVMQANGKNRLEGTECSLAVVENALGVEVTSVDLLPPEFVREIPAPPPVPDKAAIRAALLRGTVVPGAELKLTGHHLRVKT